jgi:hypothetical protein
MQQSASTLIHVDAALVIAQALRLRFGEQP